jgi:replication-associated recombination protein RarA
MANYEMRLNSGMNFYHVASAYQKCVRRGMEHEALWFGTELYMSGYAEYAWFRLRVMVSEDIGLANPSLPAQVDALYRTYLDFKKKKNKHQPEKLQYVHALLLAVRSKKSRLVDNKLGHYFDLRYTMETPELPDFVFDMHTIEGKRKGRGNQHFFDESAHIENAGTDLVPDEFEVRDLMMRLWNEDDDRRKQAKNTKTQLNAFGDS